LKARALVTDNSDASYYRPDFVNGCKQIEFFGRNSKGKKSVGKIQAVLYTTAKEMATRALLASLLQMLPADVTPLVLSGNPEETRDRYGVETCDRQAPSRPASASASPMY